MKKTVLITILGVIAGGFAGWLYWRYFGCQGSCTITSKPLNSTLYGALLGGLLFNTIMSFVKTKNEHHDKLS
jgi:hypothetical protein